MLRPLLFNLKNGLLSTIMCCLGVLPLSVNAKSINVEFEDAKYIIFDVNKSNATYVAPLTEEAEVVIPSTIEYDGKTYDVVSVGEGAFNGNKQVKSVSLPDNLQVISRQSFDTCTKLAEINLENVVGIAPNAFANCSSLKSELLLSQGGHVVEIAPEAFINCIGLTSVRIGTPGVSRACMFYDYDYATETYGENGFGLFKRCWSLENVEIYGFLYWDNGYSNHVSEEFNYSILPSQTFALCSKLKNVTIPMLERIMERAFWGCTSLTEFTMPATMKLIESEAFLECNNLKTIFFEGITPPVVRGNDPFDLDKSACLLIVPDDAVDTYRTDAYWGQWPEIITRSAWNAGVDTVTSDNRNLEVKVSAGQLTVTAAGRVIVCDCAGRCIGDFDATGGVTLSPGHGVYIVSSGNSRVKVAL